MIEPFKHDFTEELPKTSLSETFKKAKIVGYTVAMNDVIVYAAKCLSDGSEHINPVELIAKIRATMVELKQIMEEKEEPLIY